MPTDTDTGVTGTLDTYCHFYTRGPCNGTSYVDTEHRELAAAQENTEFRRDLINEDNRGRISDGNQIAVDTKHGRRNTQPFTFRPEVSTRALRARCRWFCTWPSNQHKRVAYWYEHPHFQIVAHG